MLTPKSHVEYTREVKALLPKEAFAPSPKKLFYLIGYVALIIACYCAFRFTTHVLLYVVLAVVIAHSLSCIGFIAHEISHNAVVKNPALRYPLALFAWAINLIPATVWDRVHNHTHHAHANTPKDPDRAYFQTEKTNSTSLYTTIFYPGRHSWKWNPLIGFHFIPYIFRNILSVFYKDNSKPAVVPAKPTFNSKKKFRVVLELGVIVLMQSGIYFLVGGNIKAYLFAGPLAYLFTSSILMTYIFTNHFTNPVTEQADPLLGTTSVQVPDLFNKLHFNFAYHTEHHLFPTLNSDYYPLLSKLLQEKFPERYHHQPISAVWKKLWKNPKFIERPQPITSLEKQRAIEL